MMSKNISNEETTGALPYTLFRHSYALTTHLALPLVRFIQKRRIRAGKEDDSRAKEREGVASIARPQGKLIWVHAASIGESLAVLPVIERILAREQDISVLVTTGTLTSARILKERLPERAFHQFVPFDRLAWVQAFLDFWTPSMVIWVESELWPNTLISVKERGIPAILINGRMSHESFRRWKFAPSIAAGILSCFEQCLMQSTEDARYLLHLGARGVVHHGNLKYSAPPLPYDAEVLSSLRGLIGERPVWLFASTHVGEEQIAAEVHQALEKKFPGLLTIIVPRHPDRGVDIVAELRAKGLTVAVRSANGKPAPDTAIYVADSIGELGVFFRLCPIVCMGKSLISPGGGQNPFEAAQLGCAVLFGPFMGNFEELAQKMVHEHAALQISDTKELITSIDVLLSDSTRLAQQREAASRFTQAMEDIVDKTVSQVINVLASRK